MKDVLSTIVALALAFAGGSVATDAYHAAYVCGLSARPCNCAGPGACNCPCGCDCGCVHCPASLGQGCLR